MTWNWTGWAPPRASDTPPYRDWWTLIGREGGFDCDPPGAPPCALRFWDPGGLPAPGSQPLDHPPAQVMATMGGQRPAPSPPCLLRRITPISARRTVAAAPPADLPTVDDDTVLVGVIDTGIALGHDRFCNADGSSRVLAAWQMTHAHSQSHLPFGRELYRGDIDAALTQHRTAGHLDQGGFDRALGLVDLDSPLGSRELLGPPFAHGTMCRSGGGGV